VYDSRSPTHHQTLASVVYESSNGIAEFAGLENDRLENDGLENDGLEQEQTHVLPTLKTFNVYDM